MFRFYLLYQTLDFPRQTLKHNLIRYIDLIQDKFIGQAAVKNNGVPVTFVHVITRDNGRELLSEDFVVVGITLEIDSGGRFVQ